MKQAVMARTDFVPAMDAGKSQRIPALDFTKGALVLFMVLYHWINYFIGLEWAYYRYLRFLSPSFIFISGFMISNVYLSKYEAADTRLARRLLGRGVKLIAIFVILNAARDIVLPVLSSGIPAANQADFKSILAIFVTGNFTDKIVSFSILVPIAYLLILSGILMPSFQSCRWIFHGVCVFFFVTALGLDSIGAKSMNLEIVTIGMIGILVGFSPAATMYRFAGHPYLLCFAYCLYTVAITIWNVPFLLEIAGVFLTVTVIYLAGSTGRDHGKIRDTVNLLGRYSLFGYIFQVVVLQILDVGLRHVNSRAIVLVGSCVAAFVMTIAGVEVLDRARTAVRSIDRVYRAAFS